MTQKSTAPECNQEQCRYTTHRTASLTKTLNKFFLSTPMSPQDDEVIDAIFNPNSIPREGFERVILPNGDIALTDLRYTSDITSLAQKIESPLAFNKFVALTRFFNDPKYYRALLAIVNKFKESDVDFIYLDLAILDFVSFWKEVSICHDIIAKLIPYVSDYYQIYTISLMLKPINSSDKYTLELYNIATSRYLEICKKYNKKPIK